MRQLTIAFHVRELRAADLPGCGWSGSASHLRNVAWQLERPEVEYLAACPPSDVPLGKGGIDYAVTPSAGTLFQLAVHPAVQSCGIGGLLVATAEQRIRARGLSAAELAVEESNPRARALYERLGYVAYGRKPDAWDEDGVRYETMCTLMRKPLS
ncbi:GNAT family N-acetyltransferase [Longispora sp. K20-0274]|uniref:GNAT family N-acetyltransferase n=1 Tax=Longispora sp. K20-0274 TaxID=3088255 RepID=UPI00399C3C25